MLKKVISGAQVGADIAGLRAARACHLDTGGWMPKGFKTKNGPLSKEEVTRYKLVETDSTGYPFRTRMNVANSDATIAIAYNFRSPGERLTHRLASKEGKPLFRVYLMIREGKPCWEDRANYAKSYRRGLQLERTVEFIRRNDIEVLNIAGNADTEIELMVSSFLCDVFQQLKQEVIE